MAISAGILSLTLLLLFESSSVQRQTGVARPELVFQVGHSSGVTAVAIADDNSLMATGSHDHSVRLWDLATGYEIRYLGTLDSETHGVGFTKDHKRIAAWSKNLAIVWDVDSGAELKRVTGDLSISVVAFDDRGERLMLVKDERQIVGIDFEAGTERTLLPDAPWRIRTTRYLDERVVAVGNDGSILIGNTRTGQVQIYSRAPAMATYFEAAAISDDGLLVARKLGNGSLELVDLPAGTIRNWPATPEPHNKGQGINQLQFNRGSTVIYADDGNGHIVARDAGNGQVIRSYDVPESGPLAFAVSADESTVIGSSRLADFWMVRFDGRTAVAGRQWRSTARPATSLAFSLDGQQLLIGHEAAGWPGSTTFSPRVPTMSLWDFRAGLPIRQLLTEHASTTTVAFHAAGRELAGAGAETLGRWDTATGRKTEETKWLRQSGVSAAPKLDPGGHTLARMDKPGKLTLVSVASPSKRRHVSHDAYINVMTFSRSGAHFATSDQEGMACAWRTKDSRRLFCAKVMRGLLVPNERIPLAVTDDGRWLMVGDHRNVEVFDTQNRKRAAMIEGASDVSAVTTTFDGRGIVIGYAGGMLRVRDLERQTDGCSFGVNGLPVIDIAAYPDGNLIAVVAGDGTIRVWSCRDRALLVTLFMTGTEPRRTVADVVNETVVQQKLPDLRPSEWLAITPDGLFDGTSDAMAGVTWRLAGENSIVPLDAFFTDFYRPGLLAEIMGGERPKATVDIATLVQVPGLRTLIARQQAHLEDRDGTVTVCFAEEPGVAAGISPGDRRVYLPSMNGYHVDRHDSTCRYQRTLADVGVTAAGLTAQLAEASPTVASVPMEGQPSDTRDATLHVLTVGITAYPAATGFTPLPYATRSAQAVEAVFRPQGTTDVYAAVRVWEGLYDAAATRQQIRERLRVMSEAVKPEDVVVVYLVGHGKVTFGEEMFYFVPVDGRDAALRDTAVSTAMLAEALRNLPARRVLLFLDACQAGGAIEALDKIAAVKARTELRRFSATPSDGVGIYVVAATLPLSYAVGIGDQRSALASTLLAALRGSDSEGHSARAVVGYIQRHLPDISSGLTRFRQVPLVSAVGLDFPIVR